jgi:O-antigen/teichoic acid export membrane protein
MWNVKKWARRPRVVQVAFALMISTSATAVLGVVFWIVAAHLFTTSAVGRGSAEISSMMLIAQFAQLNLANALLRFLPKAGTRTRSVVLLSYAACILVSLAVATIFLLTPLSEEVVTGGVGFAVLYAVAVPLWTIFVVQDGVLTALRAAVWVPVENVSFGVAKLALLPILVVVIPAQGVFLAWTLPVVGVVAAVSAYLFRRVIPRRIEAARGRGNDTIALPPRRQIASFVSAQYLTSIVSVASTYLLPLIVIKELGATANAHFYVPWLVGIAFHNLLLNIASSFVVESSHAEDPFHDLFWRSVKLMIVITTIAFVATVVMGPYALRLLSGDYAAAGTSLVRWIGLSFPFTLLTTLFTAALWMRRQLWGILWYQFAQTLILVGLTYALIGTLGIDAPGIANLVAVAVVGMLSIPALVRWYHRSLVERPTPDEPLIVGAPPASA